MGTSGAVNRRGVGVFDDSFVFVFVFLHECARLDAGHRDATRAVARTSDVFDTCVRAGRMRKIQMHVDAMHVVSPRASHTRSDTFVVLAGTVQVTADVSNLSHVRARITFFPIHSARPVTRVSTPSLVSICRDVCPIRAVYRTA